MSYTTNPAYNVNDTEPGALTEADLDARHAERLMPAGLDQQGRYATRWPAEAATEIGAEPNPPRDDDWLDELLANLQFWAALAVGVAMLAFIFGVISAAFTNA